MVLIYALHSIYIFQFIFLDVFLENLFFDRPKLIEN